MRIFVNGERHSSVPRKAKSLSIVVREVLVFHKLLGWEITHVSVAEIAVEKDPPQVWRDPAAAVEVDNVIALPPVAPVAFVGTRVPEPRLSPRPVVRCV